MRTAANLAMMLSFLSFMGGGLFGGLWAAWFGAGLAVMGTAFHWEDGYKKKG